MYHYSMFWVFGWPPQTWANLPDISPVKLQPMLSMYQFPVQLPPAWVPTIDWGAFGVGLFFLLSGFVISNSMQRYTPREFLINRILRIYPTYAVGFLFVVGILWLSGWLYRRGFPYSIGQVIVHTVPGLRQAVGSIYIDPVIWTLEVEIKFYVVVYFAMLFGQRTLPATALAAAAGAIAIFLSLAGLVFSTSSLDLLRLLSDIQFVVFMLIGSIFFQYWTNEISAKALLIRTGYVFALFASIWLLSGLNAATSVQSAGRIWSYGAAVLAFAAAMRFSHWFKSDSTAADFFARISYPLYVVHLAPGYLIMVMLHGTPLPPVVDIGIAFACVCLIASLLHFAVELPAQNLARRWKAAEVPQRISSS
jgi:peptidoglycan/LPS O-acetylase OafA/YrhL